jgi:phosphomannomutase
VSDAAGARPAPLRFGTSGWRGTLCDEITAPRLRRLAAAVAGWARDEVGGPPRILVAHDTRFLGAEIAAIVAATLARHGAEPIPVASPVPTPVVAHAVRNGVGDRAIVVTASHNRPADQGVKVVAGTGGGVSADQARAIEARAAAAADPGPGRQERAAAREPIDLVPTYLGDLAARLPRRGAGLAVVYDAMHGAGAGVCDRALAAVGARVATLHARRGPRFGGGAPDPSPERLGELSRALRRAPRPRLGLATDGDADRYAVLDGDGRSLSETQALALLVDHLARSGRARRGVALSIATGDLVERVARAHGLAVERHPIGFKHLSRALAEGRADVAGEESGGFAWEPIARDKDGILACALFAEMVASSGVGLRARLRALERRHGRSVCGRIALATSDASRARLAALAQAPPERVGAARVRSADLRDGVRVGLDDGFVMWRASGTEAVLRIYAEAPDARALARRFEHATALLASP